METALEPVPRKTLAQYATDFEMVCARLDTADQITPELIAEFDDKRLALADKVDRYIWRLDAGKMLLEQLDERAARAEQAARLMRGMLAKMKDYVKFTIESVPGRTMIKGNEQGTLSLQANGGTPKLEIDLPHHDLQWSKAVLPGELPEDAQDYLMHVSGSVLDTTKIRNDLSAGKELPWARLVRGSHVRIR